MLSISIFLLLGSASAFAQKATTPMAGLKTGDTILAAAKGEISEIKIGNLEEMLKNSRDMALIDVRTRREIATVGGTIGVHQNQNIPRGWLEFRIANGAITKDTPIVVYCGTNQRSPLAARMLMKMGYTNVSNYAGGFFEWRKAGLPVEVSDRAPDTALFSKPVKVAPNVWSAIGATAPGTYENGGHNNNLSFIITTNGVVVVNAGDNYQLASALHDEIKKITRQKVKYVVLENGQGHAALGSNYWQEQGAKIIAHTDAAHELKKRGHDILDRMKRRMREKASKTRLVMPDITFDKEYIIDLGGTHIELRNLGPAHSPGDIVTWLPKERLVISGDVSFHQRLLPLFGHTDTKTWLETWEVFEGLKAKIIIPGHGEATTYDQVTKYTKNYLVYLREKVGKLIEEGGGLKEAYLIDQSPYSHLPTFRQLAKRNAGHVFRAMEFE
ncbi:MAG: MBL fold metallo-hydrolase [bacterium]|nr:MBL fold metallo-hydrolase [bacterium]